MALCSEPLPVRITEERCFGTPPVKKVVPIAILNFSGVVSAKADVKSLRNENYERRRSHQTLGVGA